MKMKHTLGPWKIRTGNGWAHVYIEGNTGNTVAALEHFRNSRIPNDCMPDARLIAAAPDLLAALEEARNGLKWYQDAAPNLSDGSDDEAMVRIDAAIAKATGESA